jgi:hypothetical protein
VIIRHVEQGANSGPRRARLATCTAGLLCIVATSARSASPVTVAVPSLVLATSAIYRNEHSCEAAADAGNQSGSQPCPPSRSRQSIILAAGGAAQCPVPDLGWLLLRHPPKMAVTDQAVGVVPDGERSATQTDALRWDCAYLWRAATSVQDAPCCFCGSSAQSSTTCAATACACSFVWH